MMQGLRAKGYLLFEGSDKPQNERLNLPTNLLGYARFGQSSFLKAQSNSFVSVISMLAWTSLKANLGSRKGIFRISPAGITGSPSILWNGTRTHWSFEFLG